MKYLTKGGSWDDYWYTCECHYYYSSPSASFSINEISFREISFRVIKLN